MIFDEGIKICGMCCALSQNEKIAHNQKVSDLAYVAAKKVLEDVAWSREEVRVLFLVTQTSDYVIPSTASLLYKQLGFSVECLTLDINAGGDGFCVGIENAGKMLSMMGKGAKGVVICGEAFEEDEIKLVSATALEVSEDFHIFGQTWMRVEKFGQSRQEKKYKKPIWEGKYDKIFTEEMCGKEGIHLNNIDENVDIIKRYQDNGALVPYMICQENICGRCDILTVGAGMTVNHLQIDIAEEVAKSVLYTECVFDDLKEESI